MNRQDLLRWTQAGEEKERGDGEENEVLTGIWISIVGCHLFRAAM